VKQITDAFGEPIEEGDWILSAATVGYGRPTIGYARYRTVTLGVEVKHGYSENKVKQAGSVVVVLQHADGRRPLHNIIPVPPRKPNAELNGALDQDELPGMWDESDLSGGWADNG
jgi:hypothetical protein